MRFIKSNILALLLIFSVDAFGAIFSDNFNRANETPLGAPNWETITSSGGFVGAGVNLSSNGLGAPAPAGANFSAVKLSAFSPSKTQFSQITFTTTPTGFTAMGVACNLRVTTSGANGFVLNYTAAAGEINIHRWSSDFEFENSPALLTVSTSFSSSDTLRIECEDKGVADTISIRAYKNGVQLGTEVTGSYLTSYSAGQLGVYSDGAATGVMDNFVGGDITTGTTVTPSTASLVLTGATPTITTSGNRVVSPSTASLVLTGATPTITNPGYTWYTLPAPGSYDSNSILAGQTYPTGSWLRVVTDFAHITANYATGPLQNDINDYATAASGYTGSDSATFEIKTAALSTSQYTVTATIAGSISLGPSTASLAFAGATPTVTVTNNKSVAPTVAAMSFTGATPTIAAGSNVAVSPVAAVMQFIGSAPFVINSGAPVTTQWRRFLFGFGFGF